jgi:hypothetical protein
MEEDSQDEGPRGDGGHPDEATGGVANVVIKGY